MYYDLITIGALIFHGICTSMSAWLHAQGDFVIPIPGTTSISHLEQNLKALEVELSVDEIEEINRIFDPSAVAGLRYPHNHMTFHAN